MACLLCAPPLVSTAHRAPSYTPITRKPLPSAKLQVATADVFAKPKDGSTPFSIAYAAVRGRTTSDVSNACLESAETACCRLFLPPPSLQRDVS